MPGSSLPPSISRGSAPCWKVLCHHKNSKSLPVTVVTAPLSQTPPPQTTIPSDKALTGTQPLSEFHPAKCIRCSGPLCLQSHSSYFWHVEWKMFCNYDASRRSWLLFVPTWQNQKLNTGYPISIPPLKMYGRIFVSMIPASTLGRK